MKKLILPIVLVLGLINFVPFHTNYSEINITTTSNGLGS